MSGGSYSYLYAKDERSVLGGEAQEPLERMRDRLIELGAPDAAQAVGDVLALVSSAAMTADKHMAALRDVFKAVEWADSGDWSEERIHEALARYRAQHGS